MGAEPGEGALPQSLECWGLDRSNRQQPMECLEFGLCSCQQLLGRGAWTLQRPTASGY